MLTPIEQALGCILRDVPKIQRVETCDLYSFVGRVAADDIVSSLDIPPWPNSAMDGYAVNAEFIQQNTSYSVSQKVFAGQNPEPLAVGTVARIFTGAPMPKNANAVIMQENAIVEGDKVRFTEHPKAFDHVRPQGQDVTAGETLFTKGHVFKAADIGVLASVGLAQISVIAKPKLTLFSSGNELVEPGNSLETGQIFNSNTAMLKAMFTQLGSEVRCLHSVADSLASTVSALQDAAKNSDIVISTGGVSVGEADFVKPALEQVGNVSLWKLAIKPGKPLVFGDIANVPYFGLPGNPSSAFVTSLIAVLPFLDRMLSRDESIKPCYAESDFAWLRQGTRQEYLRVQLYNDGYRLRVRQHNNQSSGLVSSTAWANALAIIPIGQVFEEGSVLEVLPLPV